MNHKVQTQLIGRTAALLLSLPLATMPILAYVPEPQPVKSSVEITALYYPGTEQMSEWDMIAQTCPERKPLLGWYDEGNPEVIDWQIKWAVEHGISSFCVDWYWNKGFRRLEHWVKGYYKARYRKYLKWYMMYANHNQPGSHSTSDQIAVTKYWIENYFNTLEYYTIDGKPVVCYWNADNLDRDFIAEAAAKGEELNVGDGIRRAFAISEKMVKEAGFPGIHWQLMWTRPYYDPVFALESRSRGFESSIGYGLVWQVRILAPKAAANVEGRTYDMVAESIP
ncbi:MAG: glycoside hydrolase family 99-like domain-containing protein, partial [Kiritimatiellae bacterium]|nr:glycoside hydrolase family 99-like domain-containing protein [Kiritimatiellia bacterium]